MGTEYDLVIEADRQQGNPCREIWAYRELFFFLAWRDILVRYKQTVIGIAWSVLRPLLTMLIFTVVFGKVAGLPSGDTPYPLLVFAAMLPWQLFSSALSESGNSLLGNANLLSKVYFPRIIVPVSAVIVTVLDFLISFVILIGLLLWYDYPVDLKIVFLPLFILLALIASLGAGLWVAALNVRYRDLRIVIPFIVQLGLYISPVGFSSQLVPEQWRLLYSINPMVGVIDGFRWALLGGSQHIYWPGLFLSALLSCVMLIIGLMQFRKMERSFADIL